jgi:tRNA A37 methylthiotransferase MiaB
VHRIVLSAPGFLDYARDYFIDPEPLTDPSFPDANYDEIEGLLAGLKELPQMVDGEASLMIENIKASLVNDRTAAILGRYLRGTPVSVGFETGSDKHSDQIGRPHTPSKTLVAVKSLKKAGLKPYVYFIHGLPGQTRETALETVDMIKRSFKLGSDRIILYRFMSLPASAFSGCPSGPPAVSDPNSKLIYDAANKANLENKRELVGQKLSVVVANRYDRDHRYFIAYPMLHGPVILIEGKSLEPGEVYEAEITGVASDRMVYGKTLTR